MLAVPEFREIVAVLLLVDTEIGLVPMAALTYAPDGRLFCRVRNSLVSIQTRVGSTGAMSTSNSS